MCGVSTSLRFPGQLNGSVTMITFGARLLILRTVVATFENYL
jgi:hypothetical protein